MPNERKLDLKAEIGHVLLIDIVGYSKLLINEQSELLQDLKEIVRATEQFRVAEAAGTLIRLPTGDGMALVFRDNPEAPAQCALEIAGGEKSSPAPAADGDSQRAGERSRGRERARQYRGRRH